MSDRPEEDGAKWHRAPDVPRVPDLSEDELRRLRAILLTHERTEWAFAIFKVTIYWLGGIIGAFGTLYAIIKDRFPGVAS